MLTEKTGRGVCVRVALSFVLVGAQMIWSQWQCQDQWVTVSPTADTVFVCESVQFAAIVDHSYPWDLRYQWFKDTVPVPGETDSLFRIAEAAEGDDGIYRCIVTDTLTLCADTTAWVVLRVLKPADLAPTTDTAPFYTFDLPNDGPGTSDSMVWYDTAMAMGAFFTDSLDRPDFLVDGAHSPDGKPFVMNLQRANAMSLQAQWHCTWVPVYDSVVQPPVLVGYYCVPGLEIASAGFRVNAATPRHASALYLAANASATAGSGTCVGQVTISFRRHGGNTVQFSRLLVKGWDLRNWWADSAVVAPLDSNPDWREFTPTVACA